MTIPPSETTGRSHEVLVTIRRIMRAIDLHSRFLVQRHGLTGPQLILLQEIATCREIQMGELAKRANLSPPTVTSIIDRLERRGLISRRRSENDKRRVLISATRDGLEILLNSPPPLQESFIAEFESLQEWEQTLILSSLQRVAAMMHATNLDAAPLLSSGSLTTPESQEDDFSPTCDHLERVDDTPPV